VIPDERKFEVLKPAMNVGYGRTELLSPRDEQIGELLLSTADSLPFEEMMLLMPRGADGVLAAFAERAASIAVRHQDARELRAGLLASALALALTDEPREVLPRLALLYRAAEMIGNDPRHEFSSANDLTGGKAPGLVDFLERSPRDRSIQAMAYEEGDDKQGFRFLRTW
jgi:hypothetical protein